MYSVNWLGSRINHQVSGIQYYCEPSPAVLEAQIQNETTLVSQGDMYWACLNRINYCNNALWVNRDLLSVNKVFVFLCYTTFLYKTALTLYMSTSTDFSSLISLLCLPDILQCSCIFQAARTQAWFGNECHRTSSCPSSHGERKWSNSNCPG